MPSLQRRKVCTSIPLVLASLALKTVPVWARAKDTIDVKVQIRDESGRSIPYVTVWNAVEFDPRHIRHLDSYPVLNLDDLWRITERYGATHALVSEYGAKPVRGLGVSPLGDAHGTFSDELNYQVETDEDIYFARPDPLAFGYTFLKRGYFPGRLDFKVPVSQRRVEAVITLKRNPAEALETQRYLEHFAEVRYLLSNTAANVETSKKNQRRLELLRLRLDAAAQVAVIERDRRAAAQIYACMCYMPHLHVLNGRIVGFSQSDPNSAAAKESMDKAYELDPGNLFIWMNTLTDRLRYSSNASREEKIRTLIDEYEKIIAAHGRSAWPAIYRGRAGAYAALGNYEKARQLYLDAAQMEPKYINWNSQLEAMKQGMKMNKVQIPADW